VAISTENANLVWQKVKIALESLEANSFARDAIAALKAYLSQVKRNPDLQFVAISDLTDATVIADAASQVYAIYLKKQATATDAFAKFVNHASAGDGSDFLICLPLLESEDEAVLVFSKGMPFGTGIVATSSTTDVGTTDTTSGDGPNGFVILGA
jgi:hypothetical protein